MRNVGYVLRGLGLAFLLVVGWALIFIVAYGQATRHAFHW